MILAIDIGNSRTHAGLFDGELTVLGFETHPLRPPRWYRDVFEAAIRKKGMDKAPEGVVISSVVPGHTEAVRAGAEMLSGRKPLLVGPEVHTGLTYDVRTPGELGADRIAASLAGAELYGPPVAVVVFGTATTVNFVNSGFIYRGGAIFPGVGLMARALSSWTAKLPSVAVTRPPSSPLGRDTEESILSGVLYGTAGAVQRIIKEAEAREALRYRVVATGGGLEHVRPLLEKVDAVEPDLTLKGLKFIYERNR